MRIQNQITVITAVAAVLVWALWVVPAITSDENVSFLLGMPAGALAVFYCLARWR